MKGLFNGISSVEAPHFLHHWKWKYCTCQWIDTLNIYFLKGLKPILKIDVLFIVLLIGKGESSIFWGLKKIVEDVIALGFSQDSVLSVEREVGGRENVCVYTHTAHTCTHTHTCMYTQIYINIHTRVFLVSSYSALEPMLSDSVWCWVSCP